LIYFGNIFFKLYNISKITNGVMKTRNKKNTTLIKCLKDAFIVKLSSLYIKLINKNKKIIKNLFNLTNNSI
jgi:hypothetical protein